MRYSAKDYAKAFMELGAASSQIKGLFSAMKKNGDLGQRQKVVKEIERLEVKKHGGHLVEIEFARAQDAKAREEIISQFGKRDRIVTRVKPDLIAGARIIRDGEYELDISLSGKLEKLFA
ncbi:MAG TPA: F0F1 ATP synthase subunit delta [Candidatus Paceibacterota bacterium]